MCSQRCRCCRPSPLQPEGNPDHVALRGCLFRDCAGRRPVWRWRWPASSPGCCAGVEPAYTVKKASKVLKLSGLAAKRVAQAAPLGANHRRIRVVQQFIRRFSVARTHGNPDAGAHHQPQRTDLAGCRHRVVDLAGKLHQLCPVVQPAEQAAKLVATQPADHVFGTHHAAQPRATDLKRSAGAADTAGPDRPSAAIGQVRAAGGVQRGAGVRSARAPTGRGLAVHLATAAIEAGATEGNRAPAPICEVLPARRAQARAGLRCTPAGVARGIARPLRASAVWRGTARGNGSAAAVGQVHAAARAQRRARLRYTAAPIRRQRPAGLRGRTAATRELASAAIRRRPARGPDVRAAPWSAPKPGVEPDHHALRRCARIDSGVVSGVGSLALWRDAGRGLAELDGAAVRVGVTGQDRRATTGEEKDGNRRSASEHVTTPGKRRPRGGVKRAVGQPRFRGKSVLPFCEREFWWMERGRSSPILDARERLRWESAP